MREYNLGFISEGLQPPTSTPSEAETLILSYSVLIDGG